MKGAIDVKQMPLCTPAELEYTTSEWLFPAFFVRINNLGLIRYRTAYSYGGPMKERYVELGA